MKISKLNKIMNEINSEKHYSIDESAYAHNLIDVKENLSKEYVIDLFRRYSLDKDCKSVKLEDKDGLRSYELETNNGVKIKISVYENNFASVKDEIFKLDSSLSQAKKSINERTSRIDEIKKRVAGTLIVLAGAATLVGGTKFIVSHDAPVNNEPSIEDVHDKSLEYSEQKRNEEIKEDIENANKLQQSISDYSNMMSEEQMNYLNQLRQEESEDYNKVR